MNNIQHTIPTQRGHTIPVFFHQDTDLFVVDVVHRNETGGNEIVRRTPALLAHREQETEGA